MPVFAGRSGASPKRSRRSVGFLAHEIAEYAIAAALIAVGLHVSRHLEEQFILVGALLAVLNLCTRAPLGAFKCVGRRLHHVGDYAIIIICAAAPFFGFVHHDLGEALFVEAIALLLIFIEQSTRYVDPPRPAGDVRNARIVTEHAARNMGQASAAVPAATRHAVRKLGRFTGVTKRVVREHRRTSK